MGFTFHLLMFFKVRIGILRKPQNYEISTVLLSTVDTVKSKVEVSQNFVAFSEYMNFITVGRLLLNTNDHHWQHSGETIYYSDNANLTKGSRNHKTFLVFLCMLLH